ncbi:hypothetical protein [Natronolimnohabitans innermongolicus]|uniref:hypothetical protein n=1 Tax=Natronolimnohabitans innermongolicus TaxID=253107 RepID=UPI0019D3CB67|nr:hypothetical protein [Natronolimnohabitans innermongolicus]
MSELVGMSLSSAWIIEALVFILFVSTILLLLYGYLGRWIYRDAKKRGSDWAWQWAIGIPTMIIFGLIPGLLLLIIYLQLGDYNKNNR